jgi:hypothetical protein
MDNPRNPEPVGERKDCAVKGQHRNHFSYSYLPTLNIDTQSGMYKYSVNYCPHYDVGKEQRDRTGHRKILTGIVKHTRSDGYTYSGISLNAKLGSNFVIHSAII